MPTINAVQRNEATAAIARASQRTGVDFDYLLAQARLESGLDPEARARTSSATGLYQFINSTWLETVERHGSAHGLGWADEAISRNGGRAVIADPSMRAQVLALRLDPDASALMAAELARDNSAELHGFLGREPDSTELYLAHFLGAGGAREFLSALGNDPSQSAAALFPQQASANRAIFYSGGSARSVGEVMDLMRAKVADASGGEAPAAIGGGAFEFARNAATYPSWRRPAESEGGASPQRASMADTLRTTFGGSGHLPGDGGRTIAAAYGKLKAFNL